MTSLSAAAQIIEEWLLDNLRSFDPFEFSDYDTKFFRRKAFSELSLYVFLRHRYNTPPDDRLLSFALQRAGSKRYLNLPIRYPEDYFCTRRHFFFSISATRVNRATPVQ